jgi:hypothetical protein
MEVMTKETTATTRWPLDLFVTIIYLLGIYIEVGSRGPVCEPGQPLGVVRL